MDPEIIEKVQSSFDAQSMMATFGARLSLVEKGKVVITAPILPGSRQQQGFGHAALTFGLGDSAAGYAALTMMPADAEVLTVEMKINLMAPASGDLLVATGQVIKPGRRLIVVTAQVEAVTENRRKTVAVLQGTMIPV